MWRFRILKRDRIIIQIRGQWASKHRLPTFEHANVWMPSYWFKHLHSNIGRLHRQKCRWLNQLNQTSAFLYLCVLCISTSFQVLAAPESWSNLFFSRFQPFLFISKHFQWFHRWNQQKTSKNCSVERKTLQLIHKEIVNRQTDRQILWHHTRRYADFFFQLNLLPLY